MSLATIVVTAPILFTQSGFSPDFTNHLWLAWAAGKALVQNWHPGYYLNTTGLGVFYPLYAFYGGTLYALTGGLGELLAGHTILAYVVMTILAVAGAYGGTLWLGRQLGLRGWIAHAPALTVVTSAYYVTDLYGRAAWPEMMATSAIAPLLASCVHLVRTPRWRALPILVCVVSAVIFTGSHNITLLWGTTVAAGAMVAMWLALGAPRRLPYRRMAMVGGLVVAGVLVNSWFLFPDLAYEKYVAISNEATVDGTGTGFLDTPDILLDPLRHAPPEVRPAALFVQVPDWFLVWALVAGVVLLVGGRVRGRLRRGWLGAASIVAMLLTMLMVPWFWDIVPFPFNQIQFPYRLNSYLFYAVAGLVLASALVVQRSALDTARNATTRRLRMLLVGVSLISVALCVWQEWVPSVKFPTSYANRGEALGSVNTFPRTWYDGGSFRDALAPQVETTQQRTLLIEPSEVDGERFAATMDAPPGPAPIATNITGGSYLVHIAGGLEKVGDGPAGEAVVKRTTEGSGPVDVVVETTHNGPVVVGRATSIAALLLISVVLLRSVLRSGRARQMKVAAREPSQQQEEVSAAMS